MRGFKKWVTCIGALLATAIATASMAFAWTNTVSNVTSNSAVFQWSGPEVNSYYQYGSQVTHQFQDTGYCLSTTSNPQTDPNAKCVYVNQSSNDGTTFYASANITGLKPNTTYYVQDFIDYQGQSYRDWMGIVSFTTQSTVPPASATNQASIGIMAGALSMQLPATSVTFPGTTLNGSQQVENADMGGPITVTDSTGYGLGYHLNVNATQLTEVSPSSGFAQGTSAHTLPLGSLTIAPPSSVVAQGTTSHAPSIVGASAMVIDNNASVNLIDAAVATGMGIYAVNFPQNQLALTLSPGNTYVDTVNYPGQATPYSASLNFTLVSGP